MKMTTNMETLQQYYTDKLDYIKSAMNGNKFINDHNNKIDECVGLVVMANGCVCPCFSSRYYSLNPLKVINNGEVHLSTWGVSIIEQCGTLKKTIQKYNKTCTNHATKIVGYTEF